jgi:hypothetical protein
VNDRVKLAYDKLVNDTIEQYYTTFKLKEDNMCNSTKRWAINIETSGSATYWVKLNFYDNGRADKLERQFDSFELALEFVNKTHKELK